MAAGRLTSFGASEDATLFTGQPNCDYTKSTERFFFATMDLKANKQTILSCLPETDDPQWNENISEFSADAALFLTASGNDFGVSQVLAAETATGKVVLVRASLLSWRSLLLTLSSLSSQIGHYTRQEHDGGVGPCPLYGQVRHLVDLCVRPPRRQPVSESLKPSRPRILRVVPFRCCTRDSLRIG